MNDSKNDIKEKVRENYSQIVEGENKGCCSSSGCCSGNSEGIDIAQISNKLGYTSEDLETDFIEANQGLGCGNPQAITNLQPGQTVLDLGCGAGFDVFLAAREVGIEGKVIGVDMTSEMITKARKTAEENNFENVEFRLGEIEALPAADNSVDVVISNCVINLSVDKEAVFQEIYRVLKSGGRIAISDVVKNNELSEEIKDNLENYSRCITGAIPAEELEEIMEKNGFEDVEIKRKENSEEIVQDWSTEIQPEDFIYSAYITGKKPE
ncbi:arsenite methyltransferase [Acetohalobium arabaticum]|uniref:Arsenite methyltransferase n=1 Tax=Acetohalobium arabaticum (strain ATCC 49924 / DSM 5501 / Z-7288) TaxID=574087 RepID=D9QT30_ACEAZ|nr:arsenite methyltransferase [Acetohalobium arabaticum]ADL13530.1 Methyltransferase type 11 [Acetohalobium arabaticum DSM 5501]